MAKNIVTPDHYDQMVKKKTPNSKSLRNTLRAFWVGGLICIVGEVISQSLQGMGVTKQDAGTFTSISLIFISSALTALNIYEKITKYAGVGSIAPITGFANSVVSPAMEFKDEGVVTGTGTKIFAIAGPVLVFGIVTSVLVGFIKLMIQ